MPKSKTVQEIREALEIIKQKLQQRTQLDAENCEESYQRAVRQTEQEYFDKKVGK